MNAASSGNASSSKVDLEECNRVLTKVFGYENYRGQQREIVEAAIAGRDVFVLAPTGMGKSLCFQIPAVAAKTGITVVASPLLSLMKNQITGLQAKSIAAAALSSDSDDYDKKEIIDDILRPRPTNRLLYVTPERIAQDSFCTHLDVLYKREMLNRFVVDEAHCISEWGHDFREPYRRLDKIRRRYPNVPIMALTATATPAVQSDILRSLRMSHENTFHAIHPFNRDNLFYEMRYVSTHRQEMLMKDIYEFISSLHQRRGRASSGIVYCRTRTICEELSKYLRGKGLNARPYHAKLPAATLSRTQRDWEVGGDGEIGGVDVVCATIAFGMGIDKPDVRYIIHYDLPTSFEGYYQQTGRGGRDGEPAKCLLYYSREDATLAQQWIKQSYEKRQMNANLLDGPAPSQRTVNSLSKLIEFAEDTSLCRHVSICRYFGEEIDDQEATSVKNLCDLMCDVCKKPEKTRARKSKLTPFEYIEQRPPQRIQYSESAQRESEGWGRPKTPQHDENEPGYQSGCGSKRPNSSSRADPAKKVRPGDVPQGLPPIMKTKAFSSASNLNKPFKPPSFKQPVQVQVPPETTVPAPIIQVAYPSKPEPVDILPSSPPSCPPVPIAAKHLVDRNDDYGDPVVFDYSQGDESRESSPIPDMNIQPETHFSNKIPLVKREDSIRRFFKALSTTFSSPSAWQKYADCQPPSTHAIGIERFTLIARTLENMAFLMSATEMGYKLRRDQRNEAIGWLGKHSEADADVLEILQVVKNVSRKLR